MMMKKKILGAVVILALAALACGNDLLPGGGGGRPKSSPTPDNVIFRDDFSDPDSGWEAGDWDFGSVGYKDGVYFVISTITEVSMWGKVDRSFDNIVIEVDATQISAGPTNNNLYGVVCREQGDGSGYYLRIAGNGVYGIFKAELGEGGGLTPLVNWTESSAIKQGNATNHIRAVCNGSTLELHVNGEHVDTAEDSTFATGDIALTAGSYESEGTEIHFDNLVVRTP